MTEQQPSVLDQLEGQAPEQLRIRVRENLKRAGVPDPDATLERLEGMAAYRELRANLETYSDNVRLITRNVELTREERRERAADAYEKAEEAHEQLVGEWESTVSEVASEASEELFAPTLKHRAEYRDAVLRLSGASEEQLAEAVELARLSDDPILLKAARAVAHQQGQGQIVERSVAYDSDETAASSYLEHQRFSSPAIRESVPQMLQPYGLTEQQLAPPQALVDAHKRAKAGEEGRRQRSIFGGSSSEAGRT